MTGSHDLRHDGGESALPVEIDVMLGQEGVFQLFNKPISAWPV